jgi:hypothetical protein
MKRAALLIVLLICVSGCKRITADAQVMSTKSDPPLPGWVAYPKPTDDDMRCANYSKREWKVSLNGEKLEVKMDRSGRGQFHELRVDDGWLRGQDFGEFGGGLYWTSVDRRRKKRLSSENIIGFVNSSKGVLAVAGLRHMGSDYGMVLQITNGPGATRKATELADLSWAPDAFASESPDSLIVLTTNGIARVTTAGNVEQLFRTHYELLWPNSMTLSSNGVIHVGMRHFIIRLTPNGKTYDEEWFVPADCAHFINRDYDCVCSAKQ